MRKKNLRLLACAAVLTMAFSLGACGGGDENSGSKTNTEAPSESDSKDKSDKAYASIEEYMNSDLVQKELESQIKAYESQGMSIDVRTEGNKLIYSYKYDAVTKADLPENSAAELDTALTGEESTFTAVADFLKEQVDVEDPVVVVEYLDANGETILSKDFAATK